MLIYVAGAYNESMSLAVSYDRAALLSACERYGVKQLRVFGSTTSTKHTEARDVDVLVEFIPGAGSRFDAYFGLQESLEEVFLRPVDLVMTEALKNPYFINEAMRQAETLYAA